MTQALQGLRVLDLTSGPAGGMATMILADFGAEVLMVQRPAALPDVFASLPAAPMWRRGKQAVTLDLNTSDDLQRLQQLAAAADVFVSNWRIGALQRKGLDFDSMHARHPHLVYCHMSGFGARGAAGKPTRLRTRGGRLQRAACNCSPVWRTDPALCFPRSRSGFMPAPSLLLPEYWPRCCSAAHTAKAGW